jgi:hypothetical protein
MTKIRLLFYPRQILSLNVIKNRLEGILEIISESIYWEELEDTENNPEN